MTSDDTLVRTTCPACGTVELPAGEVDVVVTYDGTPPRYRYACPACDRDVEKVTTVHAVSLLHSAGAQITFAPIAGLPTVQQRPEHADREVAAPAAGWADSGAITPAEIQAFRRALHDVQDIAAAAGGTTHP